MILYFSGTGNSAYAAKFTAGPIGDEVLDLFHKIRNKDHSPMESEKPWVVAAPVYSWQLPHVVRDWMLATEFKGNRKIYFLLTCGSSMGNAEKYLRQLCEAKGLEFMGCAKIVMPENYIAMFEAPDKEKAERILNAAERTLKKAAKCIAEGEMIPKEAIGTLGKLLSGPVNKGFNKFMLQKIGDKKFYAEDSCIGCGLCEAKCPLGNIVIADGKPVWNGHCTQCMACIAYCPQEAIEYGKASCGKVRYNIEKVIKEY